MKKLALEMWPKWSLILIFVSAAPAGELNFGAPLVSGDVAQFDAGRGSIPRDLSRGQLQGLTLWLGLHRSAWRGSRAPAPNVRPLLRLNLKDAHGASASIDVVAQSGRGVVMRLTRSDTWTYKSFGGLFKSAAATQLLSDKELAVLKKILGTT
jgi:hypothetical protein